MGKSKITSADSNAKVIQGPKSLLRQRAELQISRLHERLANKPIDPEYHSQNDIDTLKLLHELEVHQIELELQNDELKKAEEKANLIAIKYTELYDFAPVGYFTLDAAGKMIEMNLTAAKMLGKERSKLIKNSFHLLVGYNMRPIFIEFLHSIFEHKTIQTCNIELTSNGHDTCFVLLRGIISENEQNCLLTAIDITEQKQVEKKLIESKALLSETEKSGQIGGWEFDIENLVQTWTDQVFEILEIDIANVAPNVPQGIQFIAEPYKEMAEKAIQRAINFGEPFDQEWEVITNRGNKKWVRSIARVHRENGKITKLSGSFQDITKQKMAELELAENNKLIRSLFLTIPFAIDIVDEKGNILFMNKIFEEKFGTEAIGRKCWELYKTDKTQCSDCPLKTKIKIGVTEIIEAKGVFGDKTFQISHTGMIFKGVKSILEIFQDVTDKKAAEEELILAKEHAVESDNLKSTFLANMSHEIRTPLNSIIGFSELLADSQFDASQQTEFAEIIQTNGNNLLAIINDIMDISKIETGQIHIRKMNISVNKLLKDVQESFILQAEKKGLEIRLWSKNPQNEFFISSDPDKIKQVLNNFIGNALKFTKSGYIELGFKILKDNIQFHIKDTGIGIENAHHEDIFERFRQIESSATRKYGGNGLGLAISKRLAELLGGTVSMKSEFGKGSTFYCTIPIKL